ncbi:MAG: cytochrome b5 domain-containing protein [Pontimonas sp.]|nr:cytochrome b5 domain-containing protein [Pontimonas sp.]
MDDLGVFDLVTGLPVHVFVTHAVVVLLPLAVVLLILVVAFPRLRQNYRYPAVGLAIIGALSAIVAEQSGEALEARVGVAEEHSEWGEMLPPVAVALAVLSVIWLIFSRMSSSRGKILAAVIGGIVVIVGIVAVVITVLAGHSGADATWGVRVSETDTAVVGPADEAAMPEAPAEEAPAPSADASVLSMETVAMNDSEDSCWSVINGNVYDLTDWISSHPGGASRILGLCGIDGTSQFEGQHGGSASAEGTLESYLLGAIGDPAP